MEANLKSHAISQTVYSGVNGKLCHLEDGTWIEVVKHLTDLLKSACDESFAIKQFYQTANQILTCTFQTLSNQSNYKATTMTASWRNFPCMNQESMRQIYLESLILILL